MGRGAAAWLGEPVVHKGEVFGSIPIGSSKLPLMCKPRGVPYPIRSDANDPGDAGNTTVLLPFKNTRRWIWAWIARAST